MAKVTEKRLRDSIMENLDARGLVEDIYRDKAMEYVELWKQRQALTKDINERGVTVFDPKREMMVENRSVSLVAQVSKQMLAIFAAMGFKDIANGKTSMPDNNDDEL